MYEYQVLTERDEFMELYHRMKAENLLWALFPEIAGDEWNEHFAEAILGRPDMLVLGGYVDGELAGFLILTPMRFRGLVGEIGLLAFRKFFGEAMPLCRGALEWVFGHISCEAVLGFIPLASRQSLRRFSELGFEEQCRIPRMSWHTKKKDFVDNVLVMLTKEKFYAQSISTIHSGTGTGSTEKPDAEGSINKYAAGGGESTEETAAIPGAALRGVPAHAPGEQRPGQRHAGVGDGWDDPWRADPEDRFLKDAGIAIWP